MTEKLIEIVIMGGVSISMFWLSYLIGVKKKMELIAGYNDQSAKYVTDKNGLARLIGRLCLLLGIASACMPIVTTILETTKTGITYAIGGYGGFIAGTVGITVLQAQDFVTKKWFTDKQKT